MNDPTNPASQSEPPAAGDPPTTDATSAPQDDATGAAAPSPPPANDAATDAPSPPSPEDLPPPSFGKQMAQLVVVPALIVAGAIIPLLLYALVGGGGSSLEDLVLRIAQDSGAGKLAFGIRDPRYQERCRAAAELANRLKTIDDDEQRAWLNDRLKDILAKRVGPDEQELKHYLLLTLGMIGSEGGFEILQDRLQESTKPLVIAGAIGGVAVWPDRDRARLAIPDMLAHLKSSDPRLVLQAAATLGRLAEPGDQAVIDAVRDVLDRPGGDFFHARLNAAIALAILGDDLGSQVVADRFLDRQGLEAMLKQQEAFANNPRGLATAQERVLIDTLASAQQMPNDIIWQRVKTLSENDPSVKVQKAALMLLSERKKAQAKNANP